MWLGVSDMGNYISEKLKAKKPVRLLTDEKLLITNVQLRITNYLISEKLKTKKPVRLLTDEKLLITNVAFGKFKTFQKLNQI